jgi:hypothetical protein
MTRNELLVLSITAIWTIVIPGILFYYIYNRSNKLYSEIDDIEKASEAAITRSELRKQYERLRVASRKSFHHNTGSRINEVKILIETKYKYL